MRIGVFGLGIIGSRTASRLQSNPDHEVRLWNRTPKGLDGEVDQAAGAAEGAEVAALYLKDSGAVRQVIEAIQDSLPAGALLLNHSTVDLETTRWLESQSEIRGWRFLDAPFTGSRDAAADGKLVYYAGGEMSLIDEATPLLLETGREVIPCGTVGQATIIKLVTNLISACTVQALSEAMATAMAQGIKPETFAKAVNSNACGSVLSGMKLPTMATGDFTTHFSLDNMLKDSRYVRMLAEGLETPAIDAVSARMAALCEAGMSNLDYSALMAPYLKP
ncbi:oxidoreductase [Haloferula helveola]|uniref:Oxidoreductase n=1 Tax=Haloferula helveola TaxID=490095 RepID=A0ABM7RCQ7_9BACT|nr:oxidoreductase [Haloferula helveola]